MIISIFKLDLGLLHEGNQQKNWACLLGLTKYKGNLALVRAVMQFTQGFTGILQQQFFRKLFAVTPSSVSNEAIRMDP